MTNQQDDNTAKASDSNRDERLFRINLFPPSYEVRGYGTEDTLMLLKKTWWLYLLMLLAMAIIILVIIYLKDGFAVIIAGVVSTWMKNMSP